MKYLRVGFIVWILGTVLASTNAKSPLVSVDSIDPSILLDIRYFSEHNFVGRRIDGYLAAKCLLTPEAAGALKRVSQEVKSKGYVLKVYDCYRPQQAVNDFIRWASDLSDQTMKEEFYPLVDKAKLFALGYIASRSGHSRGSTVDLTLVEMTNIESKLRPKKGKLLECYLLQARRYPDNSIDMGTSYDCFDIRSWTASSKVSVHAQKNRMLLKRSMEKYGFKNYEREWWHYTLVIEPYPDTYFDFPIQ